MPAAEARERGDAKPDQRAELRALIDGKDVDPAWLQRFYAQVCAAGGLNRGPAAQALIYLRRLPDKQAQPTHATPEQGEKLRGLIRTRLVPGAIADRWLAALDAGTLTYAAAEEAIAICRQQVLRSFVVRDVARGVAEVDVPDGYYALTGADERVRCYRVHTLPASGKRLVDQIVGDRASQRRRLRGAQATTVLRAVGSDTAAAAARYGATAGKCSECNRPIGDPSQPGYPHGYGPDCWQARQEVAAAQAQPPLVPLEGLTRC